MRVLTVGNIYPPHHFGGYEQVWRSAVRHLRRRGHDTRVLATDFRLPEVKEDDDPEVFRSLRWYWDDHEFANISGLERLRVERHNHAQLERHIDELRPDVVSFWAMGGMSHSLIEAVRLRGLPMVAFVHDQWLNYGPLKDQWLRIFVRHRRRLFAPLVRRLTGLPTSVDYAGAGRYVFVSDFVRREALSVYLLKDTAVAHSGIDSHFLGANGGREWDWRLLYVGRLHPDKGTEDAVTALAHLPEQATLSLAGTWDPRDEDALLALADELGLAGRIEMLGHCDSEQVAQLYRSHDVCLFPVRWNEPWGLVPLEAMASGCPVVATGRGGSGEYLRDRENAMLVSPCDPRAIASAIQDLANDDELRERIRAGGAQTAPRYTEPIFNAAVEHHLLEKASS